MERSLEMTEYHLIDHWFYLGSVQHLDDATHRRQPPEGFDNDGYKILCKLMLSGEYEVIELG